MAPIASWHAVLAVSLTSLTHFASTQAPGDANTECLNDSGHPRYDQHVRRLLDTRDYAKLLPYESGVTSGVWQVIDNSDDGWRASSTVPCNEITHVCGLELGPQENWMITQHISTDVTTVQVMVESSLDATCDPSAPGCVSVEDISLYVWETPNVTETLAADTTNYQFVSNVSNGTVVVEISGITGGSGLYLGIRDNGTCVSVSRVLVYYTVCVPGTVGLVRVDQETAFSSAGDTVQGHCVQNSISTSSSIPQLLCLETGHWKVESGGCQCLSGYFLDPSNGHCIKPPLAPDDLRVTDLTNQTLALSWSPPPPNDNSPNTGLYYTVSYYDGDQQVREIQETELNVTGLTPYFTYTFSVTSENMVSSQDPNIAARTSSVTATTLEGVGAQVVDIEIRERANVFISWSEPNPPHGRILHYNIRIIESGRETIIKEYNNTSISLDMWKNDWKISTSDNVKIQVQSVTAVGGGSFSSPVTVSLRQSSDDCDYGDSKEASENGGSPAAVIALSTLVIIFLLLSLILTSVLVYMCWKVHTKKSQTTNGAPDPTYEVVDLTPSSDKVLHMSQNSAYGQGITGQLEVNDNISYDIVQH